MQRPLLAEWHGHKARIEAGMTKSRKHGDKVWGGAQAAFVGFLERLRAFRVLDPAQCLRDVEHSVNLETEALGRSASTT